MKIQELGHAVLYVHDLERSRRFYRDTLGFPEIGYVSLAELTSLRGPLGLPVERDLHFVANKPISAYADEAHTRGRIIA